MSKFKVGDVVRCVGAADSPLVEGADYEVVAVQGRCLQLRGVRYTWHALRFELVPSAPADALRTRARRRSGSGRTGARARS